MTINEKIFKTISEKGLKQSDFAKYLNVNQSVITTWKKRGNTPPADLIVRICEFTGISIFELLEIKGEDFDQKLIKAYYAAQPGTQECIRKLLDLPAPDEDTEAKSLTSKIG